MGTVRGAWAAVIVACAWGGVARGEQSAPVEPAAPPALPAPEPEGTGPLAPEEKQGASRSAAAEAPAAPAPVVRAFGRVLARVGADQRDDFEQSPEIAQARIGVEASYGFAEAVVEADLSGRTLMRDAYVRLNASDEVRFYGGQFKAPFLQRNMASTWDLPRVGRGLVEDYLVEEHQLGGRRLGVMGEARLPWVRGLRVQGGVFQGARDLTGEIAGNDAALRVQVKPFGKELKVGSSAYVADFLSVVHRFSVGGDATVKLFGFEVTGEAMFGKLMPGPFSSQSVIATYTLPFFGPRWVVQPMVSAEALQLRTGQVGYGWGGAVGFNALLDDRFKFQLQAQRAQRADDDRPANDLALQLGARF